MPLPRSPAIAIPPTADSALLARCARRDETALGALYDRYGSVLYGLALRITGEQADAEEAVLSAFDQAWREAARFSAERGSVAAWLTMITRSRALDVVRARGRRLRLTDAARQADPPVEAAPRADQPVEAEERRTRIRRALADLPEPQREAIELAYFEGLSQSEIAARLGEPLGTVKTRVRLAMQKLRELLRPYYSEAGL